MLATPEIIQTAAQAAAVIHITVPRRDMMKVFGPAVGELMAALAAQGIKPGGPVFAHHLKMTADAFDFEVGVTVAAPVKATGRVTQGALPAARVVRAVYTGPYEGLSTAWGELTAWAKANDHVFGDDLWEIYAVGPQSTPDPAGWQTELIRPLKA